MQIPGTHFIWKAQACLAGAVLCTSLALAGGARDPQQMAQRASAELKAALALPVASGARLESVR